MAEWGKIDAANGLDKSIRQFCVATYLMGKGSASAVYISTTQGYGRLLPAWPELTAPVGKAEGPMAKQQGVYFRNFTSGLAIVNPTAAGVTVELDGAYKYTDCYGATVASPVVLSNSSGLVLLRKSSDSDGN